MNTITTIELYGVLLLQKLDGGAFNDVLLTTALMTQIKQHIALDMILKTETIIESFLVFIHHLSQRYKGLAEAMTYYDQNLVRTVITKVRKKQDLNMRRALGLPNISDLPLDKEERKVLACVYRESENAAWDALGKMVEFYDKFRIIYGKSKHGLTFQTGATIDREGKGTETTTSQFEKSALIAYDRKNADDMPMGYTEVNPEDLETQAWFNANAHLNFGQNLMAEIFTVTEAMKLIIPYVCRSHLIFALNCGEGYLPYKRNADNYLVAYFPISPAADAAELTHKQRTLDSIASKIFPNTNTNEQEFGIRTSYKNPILVQAIMCNNVTNMHYEENEKREN